ncbi:MAG: nicotinamide-nucleotide amidohydrolase family protein [Clostridia bacterium]|nr:nicotinamide-nucleotide amidohydrolase family protein [Clostridia bacterium]
MKTSIIFFRSQDQKFDGERYEKLISVLADGNIKVSDVAVIPSDDLGEFSRRLENAKNTADNLVIVDGDNCEFDIKKIIADSMETMLAENERAKSFAEAVCAAKNIEYLDSLAYMPTEATVIPNVNGVYQGFVLDANEFTLAVLPEIYSEFKVMSEKFLIPYLLNKSGKSSSVLTLKYFGNAEKARGVLENAKNLHSGMEFEIFNKRGDVTIVIDFQNTLSPEEKTEITRSVIGELKEDIYAEFNTTLSERLYDILKLKKLKLSIAESFTGGGVAHDFIKNAGASEFFNEGIVCYSNESKINRLGVDPKSIREHGAVSSQVAYQMAAGLLKEGKCDVAVATTGIAGPSSDGSDKPVGLGYIAVGMRDGVHTYRYVFSGSREEIMETAKNTALFLTIKKLKNI